MHAGVRNADSDVQRGTVHPWTQACGDAALARACAVVGSEARIGIGFCFNGAGVNGYPERTLHPPVCTANRTGFVGSFHHLQR